VPLMVPQVVVALLLRLLSTPMRHWRKALALLFLAVLASAQGASLEKCFRVRGIANSSVDGKETAPIQAARSCLQKGLAELLLLTTASEVAIRPKTASSEPWT